MLRLLGRCPGPSLACHGYDTISHIFLIYKILAYPHSQFSQVSEVGCLLICTACCTHLRHAWHMHCTCFARLSACIACALLALISCVLRFSFILYSGEDLVTLTICETTREMSTMRILYTHVYHIPSYFSLAPRLGCTSDAMALDRKKL